MTQTSRSIALTRQRPEQALALKAQHWVGNLNTEQQPCLNACFETPWAALTVTRGLGLDAALDGAARGSYAICFAAGFA